MEGEGKLKQLMAILFIQETAALRSRLPPQHLVES